MPGSCSNRTGWIPKTAPSRLLGEDGRLRGVFILAARQIRERLLLSDGRIHGNREVRDSECVQLVCVPPKPKWRGRIVARGKQAADLCEAL